MSKIRTYEDLEAEEKRLQALLYSHKESVKDSYTSFKAGLNPFKKAGDTISKMFHRNGGTTPVMRFGLDMSVDLLVRRFLLAKAGWFTKILIPFIIKNYSTHFVKQRKVAQFFRKIQGYFSHSGSNASYDKMDTRPDDYINKYPGSTTTGTATEGQQPAPGKI
jgi:hypothetical protein